MIDINLEQTVLRNLLTNDAYARKVAAFIQPEYFEGVYKGLFKEFTKFIAKYNQLPTMEAFKIEIDDGARLTDEQYRHAIEILPNIFTAETENLDWLVDRTEGWCQDRAVYNSIMESIQIIDGKHETATKNAIPDILSKALAISFDTNIGHDYLEDLDRRFDFYHTQEERIPFDLEFFNTITKGGMANKSLNIVLAGTGVGKSLFMCHVAASALVQSKNVLYITMEMAEERIAERIDANLMNVDISQIENMTKENFKDRAGAIQAKTNGKLIIKEYPTGQANTSHFRALLNEMKLKKNFVPDVIFIDYLNICSSARMKGMGGSINSYSYIKSIAEEIRGLAVEFNLPIMSATQTTRSGYGNDDVGLEDTSESFGLPATADLMFALISNEELNANGQILVKQLKNRYNDATGATQRFVIGVDRSRMKLFDVDQTISPTGDADPDKGWDDKPIFDNTSSGKRLSAENNKFKGFKV